MVGKVTQEASNSTGLPEGLRVVTTAGDQPCGALGAGVNQEGMLAINGGISCSLESYVKELKLDPNLNYFIEISPTGDYLLEDSIWSGGSAKSSIWNQIFADILDVEVSTLKTAETTALGAAIRAAKGGRVYSSFQEAVEAMVHVDKRFLPDPEKKGLYDKLYPEVYSKFYDRVQDLIHTASGIVE